MTAERESARDSAIDSAMVPAIVAGAAAAVTATVYGVPPILFGYPLPGAALFVAALSGMSALVVAVCFALRHRRLRTRTDLLVATIFGAVALIESVLPLVGELQPEAANIAFWSRVVARTLVALGLCATAWLPERPTRRRALGAIAVLSTLSAVLVVTWASIWASVLPPSVSDAEDTGAALVRTVPVLGFRLVGSAVLLVAAIGFVRKARDRSDLVFNWLAAGAVVIATARVHDFLFPSMHNDWVTTGDMLRVVAHWVVIVGLLVEITRLWRGRAAEARRRERRRLAAELHDGLAQELAFLRTTSSLLASDPANRTHLANVQEATERALSEARLAIAEYGGEDVALAQSIADVASEVESRFGCHVLLDLDDVSVGARTAHELERAAREALLNAARHAAVDEIRVSLDLRDDQVRLSVADDGLGFSRPGAPDTRFGLTAMRERAERLGGRCSIRSAPRHGTSVAIEVPRR